MIRLLNIDRRASSDVEVRIQGGIPGLPNHHAYKGKINRIRIALDLQSSATPHETDIAEDIFRTQLSRLIIAPLGFVLVHHRNLGSPD